ncbi:cilia- and flagella-associated protein 161 [Pyxicephalus adspersus]|uniref:cilia- and flagella-associated protein 161 n=1 Tax=Pyxicephalus adspersus TaxID=30357 RepID=UPI003B59D7B5
MSIRTFSASVRIGNWNEDISLDEDLLKDFLEKREKGELLVQKSSRFKQNVMQKAELSISTDGFLHFGDVVMLLNPENSVETLSNPFPIFGNYTLSANPDESAVHLKSHLTAPCGVSGSSNIKPCARNAFIITRTLFGKECEVTAHTYLNSHKVEESENHWIIVTGNPSDDINTMFDRPKPPSEEMKENKCVE